VNARAARGVFRQAAAVEGADGRPVRSKVSPMASATAKPDDEPAGAKKSVKRAASPAAPDVTKRAAVDAAAPVEASVGPMPV